MTVLWQDRLLTEVHIGRCCADTPNHSHLTEEGGTDHIGKKPHIILWPCQRVASPVSSLCCNPGVLKDLLGWVTLEGVDDKAPANQLLSRIGHLVPVWRVELEKTREDLVEELLLVVGATGEGGIAAEEDVHDHTNRPDVNLKSNFLSVCLSLVG